MELSIALFIAILIVALVFLTARVGNVRIFSAIILGLLVGYLALITLRPWSSVEGFVDGGNGDVLLYLLISFLVPLIIIVYVIYKALQDRR